VSYTPILTVLRLPQGSSEIVAAYATASGRSVSYGLGMLLNRGLVIHLKGENALVDAIHSLHEER
jgi:hypothetical protein